MVGKVSQILFLNTDTEWILNFTSIIAFHLAGRNLEIEIAEQSQKVLFLYIFLPCLSVFCLFVCEADL